MESPRDPIIAGQALRGRGLKPLPSRAGAIGRVWPEVVVFALALGTGGLFAFVWWWRATKEADGFTGHQECRPPLVLSYAALALAAVLALPALAVTAWWWLGVALAGGAGLWGWILGARRLAMVIRLDERRRGRQDLFSPWLLWFHFLPIVHFVGVPVVLERLQRGLNGAWTGTNP